MLTTDELSVALRKVGAITSSLILQKYISLLERKALDDDEIQDIINRSGLDEEFFVNQQRAYNG